MAMQSLGGQKQFTLKWKRVFFEREALDYPLGRQVYQRLQKDGYTVQFLQSHNRVTGIPGREPREAFFAGKSTLVFGIRRTLDFVSCKPSAHYQLPLVTGCAGICEYCYLNTQLGKKPYVRAYVNVEEILNRAVQYIETRQPNATRFEASATSDPLVVEPYTGALARTILFFSRQDNACLRFVTKFPMVDSLLDLDHRGHTRIRFSINSERVVNQYEHRTPSLQDRLHGLGKVMRAGYPAGVIIAPVILEANWQAEYRALLEDLDRQVNYSPNMDLHFEIISHRFTRRARSNILEVFPTTTLPMNEAEGRSFKYGQFGYGKFVYTKERLQEMKDFFQEEITRRFPEAAIDYII